jgi:MYXO-CTERM domain-containing protein
VQLSWSPQDDVSGYQVWRADSPYAYIAKVDNPDSGSYFDPDGDAGSTYLVTAFVFVPSENGFVGFTTDINTVGVPNGDRLVGVEPQEPSGSGDDDDGDSTKVPFVGPFAVLAGLAVLALARRRLA